ncbi:MAG: succinate dehydrogenase, hydrophobic membrane anchor protein [Gammaproteobacteria bacterium]|nr:MAG: succinate dehydrogenase, hydrophobic membrane anchor protein [Gammaproteobacteria bacterium]
MKFRTPLSHARGLGSAKEGTGHWWAQRLTAIALVPLMLWFAWSIIGLTSADYATVHAWIAQPTNAGVLLILIYAAFYHSMLGLQVIIEDYVHVRWMELMLMILVRFASIILGVAAALAVVLIATES